MSGKAELQEMASLIQALRADWTETSTMWRDSIREEFQRQFWDDWETILSEFMNASSDISKEIDDALQRLES
ncbi:MAG TPA: hypothetical protein VNW97_23380 [Candidatus Saccharimonadales bacterium]|jgi:hypothetical protein|nr:hypothetical protein [Candidatus Saccharimonadales bacterium]